MQPNNGLETDIWSNGSLCTLMKATQGKITQGNHPVAQCYYISGNSDLTHLKHKVTPAGPLTPHGPNPAYNRQRESFQSTGMRRKVT